MNKQISLIFGMMLGFCPPLKADDTEIYLGSEDARNAIAPKLLIVLDTSASMGFDWHGQKPPYITENDKKKDNSLKNKYHVEYGVSQTYLDSPPGASMGFVDEDPSKGDFIYYQISDTSTDTPFKNLYGKEVDEIVNIVDSNPAAEIPSLDSDRRFHPDLLNCQVARDSLEQNGFYTGYLRNYQYESGGTIGSWESMPERDGELAINAVECFEDIYQEKPNNSKYLDVDGNYANTQLGYPVDDEASPYTNDNASNKYGLGRASKSFASGKLVTIYKANYLRWAHSDVAENRITKPDGRVVDTQGFPKVSTKRLFAAQRTLQRIVNSSPGVNYGLMRFSGFTEGGQLITNIATPKEIKTRELRDDRRKVLEDILAIDLGKKADQGPLGNDGSTPLTESGYEAFSYLKGDKPVTYPYKPFSPEYGELKGDYLPFTRDVTSIRDASGEITSQNITVKFQENYRSPFKADCDDSVNVALLTDGEPSQYLDEVADPNILATLEAGDTLHKKYLFVEDHIQTQVPICEKMDGRRCVKINRYPMTRNRCYDYYINDKEEKYKNWKWDPVKNQCHHTPPGIHLPLATKALAETDFNPDLEGDQKAKVFVISYANGVTNDNATNMLKVAGAFGKGGYINAYDEARLTAALQAASLSVTNKAASFSAPAAVTSNDRTRTDPTVFYSQFIPSDTPRWTGNLRKYIFHEKPIKNAEDKVVGYDSRIVGVGVDGKYAVATDKNSNLTNVRDFWSKSAATDVEQGGVQEALREQKNRILYYDTLSIVPEGGKSLPSVKLENNSVSDDALQAMEDEFGTAFFKNAFGGDLAKDYVRFYLGLEKSRSGTFNKRTDIFGDPLHSQPIVVNYGSPKEGEKRTRIIVGTNQGVLHAFRDMKPFADKDTPIPDSYEEIVQEEWAYLPLEMMGNSKKLVDNIKRETKAYGIDGSPVVYLRDFNGDGHIDHTVTEGNSKAPDAKHEQAILYFGLRRGGRTYYALDISNPDAPPKLLWKIKGGQNNAFRELGQSWSKPKMGQVRVKQGSGAIVRNALFFGAGYDASSKDVKSKISTPDTMGRGVFVVDAETGKLIWKATPKQNGVTDTAKHFTYPGVDSVPASVFVFDGNFDGIIDRIYFGDTGGQVWRADMPGFDTEQWSVHKFADLTSKDDAGKVTNDIRFYHAPDIARGYINRTTGATGTANFRRNKTPYEAIVIASGNRASPLTKDTTNGIFVLRDYNIVSRVYSASAPAPAPLTLDKLYKNEQLANQGVCSFNKDKTILDDKTKKCRLPKNGETAVEGQGLEKLQEELRNIAAAPGWYYQLKHEKNGKFESGEKVLSQPLILNGIIYVNSYLPLLGQIEGDDDIVNCGAAKGEARSYKFSLSSGYKMGSSVFKKIGNSLTSGPGVIVGS